jgi:hypothetical protein
MRRRGRSWASDPLRFLSDFRAAGAVTGVKSREVTFGRLRLLGISFAEPLAGFRRLFDIGSRWLRNRPPMLGGSSLGASMGWWFGRKSAPADARPFVPPWLSNASALGFARSVEGLSVVREVQLRFRANGADAGRSEPCAARACSSAASKWSALRSVLQRGALLMSKPARR